MKILVTGANGYIGTRLIPLLVESGFDVVAFVRSKKRIDLPPQCASRVQIIEGDLLIKDSLSQLPRDIDVAYYLVHSMGQRGGEFADLELAAASNFVSAISSTGCKQVIYLSGIVNDLNLSPHLSSRYRVEKILSSGSVPVTILKAGIIIGSGSASFEIIRDLVEKLPVMVAPKWVNNLIQPIGIFDVLFYLKAVILNSDCLNRSFEIGCPDVLTYKEMLLGFARVRGLKRWIVTVPVLTPHLSSYWLYFITSTNYFLAQELVESLKNQVVVHDHSIQKIIPHVCFDYETMLRRTFAKIEENGVISSWKDSLSLSSLNPDLKQYVEVPHMGCFVDRQIVHFSLDPDLVLNKIWSIGGETGWYTMNWAWTIRGFLDQLVGGVGLRRGRTHKDSIQEGDALDFWRVLLADREAGRLLLYAEMRLPGEAWLEFRVEKSNSGGTLIQTATFRPKGILGRIYWLILSPFHHFIFGGMSKKICSENQ